MIPHCLFRVVKVVVVVVIVVTLLFTQGSPADSGDQRTIQNDFGSNCFFVCSSEK